jgi:hypothetical protein
MGDGEVTLSTRERQEQEERRILNVINDSRQTSNTDVSIYYDYEGFSYCLEHLLFPLLCFPLKSQRSEEGH